MNYFSFALSAAVLGPLRCKGKYDVILVYEPSPITVGLPAIVLRFVKSAPVLFWVQDLWPESLSATGAVKSTWVLRLVGRLVKFIYARCDLILVQSNAFTPCIERFGVDRSRVKYFPNSAEKLFRVVDPPDARVESTLPKGFRVMFAGNIGASQDFGTILEAAERLKEYAEIQWIVIGDGRMRSWVEEQVHARGLANCVHLLGRHPVEAMPEFFSCADLMLVTLKKEYIFSLTIPAKIQSYLACGKPVVAALDGEGSRVVEEAGAGFVCPSEDSGALAERVLAAYRTPSAELREMGLRGLSYFKLHFESGVLLDRLTGWMDSMRAGS